MGIAAQVGDPLVRMGRISEVGVESGLDRRLPQPSWAVAIGLSMGPAAVRRQQVIEQRVMPTRLRRGNAMASPNELSFLPEDYLEQKARRRANVLCLSLSAVVLVAIGATFMLSERSTRDVQARNDRRSIGLCRRRTAH